MTLHARLRHHRIAASALAFLLTTALFAGCAGGPKFSRISPADWPGIKQVRGAGKSVGGWVAEKAQRKQKPEETAAARRTEAYAGRKFRQESTNEKLKSIFAASNNVDTNQSSDPFLAKLTDNNPAVESVSHSDQPPISGQSTQDRLREVLQPVAHSLDGPEVSTPDAPTETAPVKNPFADFASEPRESEKPTTKGAASQSFSESIDSQLARLREEAKGSSSREIPETPTRQDNPLRDAILGSAGQKKVDLFASLPETVAPEDIEPIAEGPSENLKDNISRAKNIADNELPAWARETPTSTPEADGPSKPKSLPVADSATESINESPFAEPSPESARPALEAPANIPDEEPIAEPTPVATDDEDLPPAAIEIVPFDRNTTIVTPDDDFSSDIATAIVEEETSAQVELLPAPVESPISSDEIQSAQLQPDQGSTNGMIVESDALPLGFVEWDDAESAPFDGQNFGNEVKTATTPTTERIPTRFAVNSNPSNATAPMLSETGDENPFAQDIEQPRLMREIPESPVVEATASDVATPPALDPHLFESSEGSAAIGESSLETVDWSTDSKPSEKAASSPVGSTAVIGLLIALACLIGLGLIRRLRAA